MELKRNRHGLLCAALAIATLLPGLALGVPVIISANVSLTDPVYGNLGPQSVSAPGSIVANDGSPIGNALLDYGSPYTESIGVGQTTLTYNVIGGVLPCAIGSGWSCTGYGAGAHYTFDLSFSDPGDFVKAMTLVLTNTSYAAGFGASLDSTGSIVTMDVGANELGVRSNNNGTPDFGSVELDLTIANNSGGGGGTPVPEPATGAMLSLGVALVGLFRRRRDR